MGKTVSVSVVMITFNHSKYISQAIDSVLMQECDFGFELLIGDDCSNDGTQDIIRQYQEKYPDIIKPIFHDENVGGTRNSYDLFMSAEGKYISLLEGDDYWTDKKKLQKQHDFLENNPEYSGCGCEFRYIHEDGELFFEELERRMKNELYAKDNVYTLEQLNECKLPSQTGTLFFRNVFKLGVDGKIMYEAHRMIGDFTQILLILSKGNIYRLPECMAHYRYAQNTGSSWSASEVTNPYVNYDRFMYYIRLERYASEKLGLQINLRCRKVSDFKYQVILNIWFPTYARKKAVRQMLKAERKDKFLFRKILCYERLWKNVPNSIRSMYICNKHKNINPEIDKNWRDFTSNTKNKDIVLYGAGGGCIDFSDRYHLDYDIDCVIDNDPNKQGRYVQGYPIRAESYLDTLEKGSFCVIITTGLYMNEIAERLIEKGITNIYSYTVMESKKFRYWSFTKLIKDYSIFNKENK